jgi:hypothetical protein
MGVYVSQYLHQLELLSRLNFGRARHALQVILPSLMPLQKIIGWVFDGKERPYTNPFAKFPGLDTNHLISLRFSGFGRAVTLGPIASIAELLAFIDIVKKMGRMLMRADQCIEDPNAPPL